MDITGKLIKILPETRGESPRGPWVRGGFVIETEEAYPRQIAFTCFGEDRIAMITPIQIGTMVQVTFSIESREYQERWYTDVRCIRVQPMVMAMPTQQPVAAAAPAAPIQNPGFATAPTTAMPPTDDDLPF